MVDFDFDFPAFGDNIVYEPIYRNLSAQKCILILGPNLAKAQQGGEELPLHEIFSMGLCGHLDKYKVEYDVTQKRRLPYIALRWLRGIKGMDNITLRNGMQGFYKKYLQQQPDIFTEIAKLPFHLIINTSPDNYLLSALNANGKKAQIAHYNYKRNRSESIGTISAEEPLIYNLFGYFEDDESLVITKDDQLDFLNNLMKNVSVLPKNILSHFDKEKTYLFLGFDSQSWHLPLLFRSLKLQENNAAFYSNDGETSQLLRDFYVDSFNFHFVDNSITEFVEELNNGYIKWVEQEGAELNKPKETGPYVNAPEADLATGKAKVLLMTSNPRDAAHIELNKEINSVEAELNAAPRREEFELKPILDINKERLSYVIESHQPAVLHFAGHGTGQSGLLFYGESGNADAVEGQALANLLKSFDSISCVVLNACFSETQAEIIARHIPNVVGTDNAIGDEVALAFSTGFYRAIFAGNNYEKAFEKAIAHVGLYNFPEGGRPIFYKEGKRWEGE